MSFVNTMFGLVNQEPYFQEALGQRWTCDLCGYDYDENETSPEYLTNPDDGVTLDVCVVCFDDEMLKIFALEEKDFLGAITAAQLCGKMTIVEYDSEIQTRYQTWLRLRGVK